jgi:uncharacterized membrane protein
MSQTYISAVIVILSQLLPVLGIQVGSDAVTTTVSTLVAVVAGIWIMIRRLQQGDINVVGARKQ